MKKIFFLLFLSVSCKTLTISKMEKPELIFYTTDNKRYALRVFDSLLSSTLPNGQIISPTLTVCRNESLVGASTNAWEPTLYQVIRPIIPIMFTQYCWTNEAYTPNTIYRFNTPFLIERGIQPAQNKWPALLAPYAVSISQLLSFYGPPAGNYAVNYSGTVMLNYYEKIPFSSIDFKTINSPGGVGSIPAVVFDPTTSVAAFVVQQQQATPFPLRSGAISDYGNTISIAYQPNFGADVLLNCHTNFVYFELLD